MQLVPPWFRTPTFGARITAAIVDWLILLPFLAATRALPGQLIDVAAGLGVGCAYSAGCVAARGRTPGKQLLDLYVLDATTGQRLAPGAAVTRWFILAGGPTAFATLVPGLRPLWMLLGVAVVAPILLSPLHQGLHDRAAHSLVSATRTGHAGQPWVEMPPSTGIVTPVSHAPARLER
jgi:uncharacterized RDD family membrane protein YckC